MAPFGSVRARLGRSKASVGGKLVGSSDAACHLTRALLSALKRKQQEDEMYPATQDAITAQIVYRQHRLADDFRGGVRTNTRRWNRGRR
jgi:hypothetical protein